MRSDPLGPTSKDDSLRPSTDVGSDSPEVAIIRLAYELGQMSGRIAELRRMDQRLRERLGLDDEDDIHA